MHVGASINIPCLNNRDLPRPDYGQSQAAAAAAAADPFEGLPFRAMADRLGEAVMPTMQAAREAERAGRRAQRAAIEQGEVVIMPTVPHVLPFTRWAASSTKFQSTFIADPPKERKRARLSWCVRGRPLEPAAPALLGCRLP